MKVICASCLREGAPGKAGERSPLEDPAPTRGICARHQEQSLEPLPPKSFPGVHALMVVQPNDTALYEYLQRSLAGVRHVQVMMERRADDRRREQHPVADDRRRERRRIRQGKVSPLGYIVVKFKTEVTADEA
jgi:hypothetical protein